VGQDATGRFCTTRGGEIDLFRIDLSANAINHEIHKQQMQLIVNKVANDLQCNSQLGVNSADKRLGFQVFDGLELDQLKRILSMTSVDVGFLKTVERGKRSSIWVL
tara:strand:+ start:2925 stop:3242 length:318 start_codon:yes stop_codon:yes gene_type:complete